MSKPSDSTPNFDWLQEPGAAEQKPEEELSDLQEAAGPNENAIKEEAPPESESQEELDAPQSSEPASQEPIDPEDVDEGSVFSDLEDVPQIEENVSDGLTLVIHKPNAIDNFSPEEETFESEQPTDLHNSSSDNQTPSEDDKSEDVGPTQQGQASMTPQPDSTPNFGFLDSSPKLPASSHPSPQSDEADSAPASFDMNSTAGTDAESTSDREAEVDNPPPTPEQSTSSEEDVVDPETASVEETSTTADSHAADSSNDTSPETQPHSETPKGATFREAKFLGLNQGLALILLASYASAITLILLMMLMRSNKPHHLESLPDVIPEEESRLTYVPVNAPLAPGHTLKVGDSERYGNLKVEVLRITREPITFVHYNNDASRTKPPTEPVWKLWLKFTNVSEDQTFAPLDRDLTLRWIVKAEQMREYSNYYITQAGVEDPNAKTVQMYRLPKASDWDMQFQNLGKELQPGESTEAFIATSDEQPIDLSGNLVWRFQFRKGKSPNGNGVTTMVEVAFNSEEVASAS